MATTKQEIKEWLLEGLKTKSTHVITVCDTFDHEDYPVYVKPGGNVKDIYDKIMYFWENPNESKRMGNNARKMAEAFPWKRHEEEYIKFIKSV